MLKNLKLNFIMIFTFIVSISSYSQNFSDLSSVNFSELNNSQIDLLLRRAGSQGYSQFDFFPSSNKENRNLFVINSVYLCYSGVPN